MSWGAWLVPSPLEHDAAVVATGDDGIMQLLGDSDFRGEVTEQREALHHAEESLRRGGLAVRALPLGVPQTGNLCVEQLEELGPLVGRAGREVLGEPLPAPLVEVCEAVEKPFPLVGVEPVTEPEVDELVDLGGRRSGRVGGGNDHVSYSDDGVVLMRVEDFEGCAAAESCVQRAAGGKEGVGEYRGAAEG